MEVLSDSTRKYDRGEKMEIYRKMEIDEYWIVDWERKQIEIFTLDYDEHQEPQYHLFKTITRENKNELEIVHFPDIKISFDEMFDIQISHNEALWLTARGDLPATASSDRIIGKRRIGDYFSIVKSKYNMLSPGDIREYAQAMFIRNH